MEVMKMKHLLTFVFLTGSLLLSAAQQVKIVAQDKEAGEFLKSKSSKILGQTDFSKGEITLYVGRTSFAAQSKALPIVKKHGDFGYRIWSRDGKNIVIVGTTPTGTLFAAGDFLKRFAGWRVFYPGETGEVLPKLEKLNLPEKINISEAPTILHYNSACGSRDEIFARVKGRNIYYATNHAMNRIVPPAKYAKTHPEYYPLRYGKRVDVSKNTRAMGWNPCISNPDIIGLMREYLKPLAKKGVRNMTLSVNDGGADCLCEKCQALFDKYGNQYAEFYKACSDEIGAKYPGKLGVFIAYGVRSNQAPKGIQLGPNLLTVICGARPGIYDRELEAWKNAGISNVGIYDYYYTFGSGYMTPRFYPHDLAEKWRRAYPYGLKALIFEVYSNSSILDAPRLYVMDELGWNIHADVDALLQDYYVSMFGTAAAPEVKKFYDRLEEIFIRKKLPSYYNDRRKAIQFDGYTLADLDYLKGCLDRALKVQLDPMQKRRLELLQKTFALSALCIEVAVRGREAVDQTGSPEEIADYVAKGYAAFEKLQKFTMTPEEEKEIFVHGPARWQQRGINTVEKFKRFHLEFLLQPLLDNGAMTAFDRISAKLGPESARKFWAKYPALPPAKGQLALLDLKAKNLLPNPGFESQEPSKDEEKGAADWGKFSASFIGIWSSVGADFSLAEKEKHSGKFSGRIARTGGSSCFLGRSKLIARPDTWYRFSVWAKCEGNCSGSFSVRFFINGKRGEGYPPVTVTGGSFTPECIGKWVRYYRYFRTPACKDGVITMNWLIGPGAQKDGDALYIDDLELVQITK